MPSLSSRDDHETELNDEERMPVGKDPNDPLVDPDFQYFDEGAVSDENMSEACSDTLTATAKVKGRRPGRPRTAHLRDGPHPSKRGRREKRLNLGRGGKGIKKGPRKPLEPNLEFKALQSQATLAFIDRRFEEAEQLALRAIHFNPEVFAAHSLLFEIHMARGDREDAVTALFNGAHTRPRDVQVWLRVARMILEREEGDRNSSMHDAIYCLSRVIAVQQENVNARYQRASLNRELGLYGRAAHEYEQLLKYLPRDATVLRDLTKTYIEMGEIDRALKSLNESIAYHQSNEPTKALSFGWSDVNIYVELFAYQDQYDLGIKKLKSLSRWLLGRRDDDLWESFEDDDREWDADDHPRRDEVSGFVTGRFPAYTYGDGLPLELRVKLGVYRLRKGHHNEALNHFAWLEPEDYEPGAKLFIYDDLFREAADALRAAGLYQDALHYYEPLQENSQSVTASYLSDLAYCYQESGLQAEAVDCYQTIIGSGDLSVDIRPQLTALGKEHGGSERADQLLEQLSLAERQRPQLVVESVESNIEAEGPSFDSTAMLASRPKSAFKPHAHERAKRQREQEQQERNRDNRMYNQFLNLQALTEKSRRGDKMARSSWMAAAKFLIQDFRSNSIFYPTDKFMRFLGYTSEARASSAAAKPSQTSTRAQHHNVRFDDQLNLAAIPEDYRGIPFRSWLDIFLEYALNLAHDGKLAFSYDVIAGAREANIFYHSPDSLLLIHVCWFTCALLRSDEAVLCDVSRWFTKEYQFTTDGYRLFSALNRLCDTENCWFNCGPSQKFILRQIKAVDFPLMSHECRKSIFQERASYNRDETGKAILATELDVALLMLYGHVLYAGKSFAYALNYFFRAYALDPSSAMINLSIALSYIHHALKRQADNRHYLVMQGLSFLTTYYDIRYDSDDTCGRQEAEYNTARAFHLLGLTQSAIPYYQRCLDLEKEIRDDQLQGYRDDFSREAALALQGLWAVDGNRDKAHWVTEGWLTL